VSAGIPIVDDEADLAELFGRHYRREGLESRIKPAPVRDALRY
jgi:hypothetical protein